MRHNCKMSQDPHIIGCLIIWLQPEISRSCYCRQPVQGGIYVASVYIGVYYKVKQLAGCEGGYSCPPEKGVDMGSILP